MSNSSSTNSGGGTGKEPRIRSTCNACQDAKVRCSRDKPICRRCQNQNRPCLYSYSQRLGRPPRDATIGTDSREDSRSDDRERDRESVPVENGRGSEARAERGAGARAGEPGREGELTLNTGTGSQPPSLFRGVSEERQPDVPGWDADTDIDMDTIYKDSSLSIFSNNHNSSSLDFDQFFDSHNAIEQRSTSQKYPIEGNKNDFELDSALFGASHSELPSLSSSVPTSSMSFSSPQITPDSNPNAFAIFNANPRSPLTLSSTSYNNHNNDTASYQRTTIPKTSYSESDILHASEFSFRRPVDEKASTLYHESSESILTVTKPISEVGGHARTGSRHGSQRKCYIQVLHRLADLYELQHCNTSSTTIDQVMEIEKDIREQIFDILDCRFCSIDGPRIFVLLGVVLENVVDLLEGISSAEMLHPPESPASRLVFERDSHQNSSNIANSPQQSNNTSNLNPMSSTSLRLGAYEISGEEKSNLLKHIIHTRLQKLVGTIRKLHDHMHAKFQPANIKTGTMMMVDIHRRLQAVIHRVASN